MTDYSKFPLVVDAIVGLLRADTTFFRAPAASGSLPPVYDGPFPESDIGSEPVVLAVGWDGDRRSGRFTQEHHNVAAQVRPRREQGLVPCVIVAHTGDGPDATKVCRDLVFSVLGRIEALTRDNPGLGIPSDSGFRWAIAPVDADLYAVPSAQGVEYRCEFGFSYDTILR